MPGPEPNAAPRPSTAPLGQASTGPCGEPHPLVGENPPMPLLVQPAIARGSLVSAPQPTLEVPGRELVLRPWRPSDAEAVREAYQDAAIQRWHVRRGDSVDEVREWIEAWRGTWAEESAGHWAMAAPDAEGGTVRGRITLKRFDLYDGTAEVAYWVTPAARGTGTCRAALETLTRWAFGTAGFHRVDLEHSTANPASCRVAVTSGYALEGTRRSAALHADGRHDMHLHARLAKRPTERPGHAAEG